MPVNYNFEENWYDIIVPLLNDTKIKKSIKKGILGYMNNELKPNKRFKSYQNIFDHLETRNTKLYLNINSFPEDYSNHGIYSYNTSDEYFDWKDNLINKLIDNGTIDEFEYHNEEHPDYDTLTQEEFQQKYNEYNDYIQPTLEPYIQHYKKTNMRSYCLWGGCHWWNPSFCLTLAKMILPKEKWCVRSSEDHTTIINQDETKIFDILYFDKNDPSFGGNYAYEQSGSLLIYDQTKIDDYKKELYEHALRNLNTNVDLLDKNINKIEDRLKGIKSLLLNNYNDIDKGILEFEEAGSVSTEFPDAKFEISLDNIELDKVITNKKKIKLTQSFKRSDKDPIEDKIFIIESDKPMTNRYIINELVKQNFTLDYNHDLLENLIVKGNKLEYISGN